MEGGWIQRGSSGRGPTGRSIVMLVATTVVVLVVGPLTTSLVVGLAAIVVVLRDTRSRGRCRCHAGGGGWLLAKHYTVKKCLVESAPRNIDGRRKVGRSAGGVRVFHLRREGHVGARGSEGNAQNALPWRYSHSIQK
ncbi:hypothetical protein SCLCIDRAFT_757638 [Scleroderma citrinum Foug A]|uniref:Uncharacterized protein n=1 Tax=Scleroderma citrinum Foug A TaxID=1036808 RepID=A0A0C2ZCU7_9AGAM|nr:hypothetical protein SCLCIDRAFT_757638 [Scleroderma citrinum Foug A]